MIFFYITAWFLMLMDLFAPDVFQTILAPFSFGV